MCVYLNETRDDMIKRINEAQTDALKRLETIRNEIELINQDNNTTVEEKKEKIYARVFAKRFVTILQIEKFWEFNLNNYRNPNHIKFYLLDTDFYMREHEADWLFFMQSLYSTIQEGNIQVGERIIQLLRLRRESSEQIFVYDKVKSLYFIILLI